MRKFYFHKKDNFHKFNLQPLQINDLFWDLLLKISSWLKTLDKEFWRKWKSILVNIDDLEEYDILEKCKKDMIFLSKLSYKDFIELYWNVFKWDNQEKKFIAMKQFAGKYLNELIQKITLLDNDFEEYILEITYLK